ncbi:MAG: hypothetical protein HYW25_01050 [Candidatus Aenigmarchaeota archaeon]|nr:hypothetical protein [Candidatus Aenigmarchaeota archaeon]
MSQTVEDRLNHLEERVQKLEAMLQQKPPVGAAVERKLSLTEFLRSKNPKNHVETIVCMSYYLEKFRNKAAFTRKDIDACYSEARQTKPKNISDLIGKAAQRGLVMMADDAPSGVAKAWVLTTSGLDFVEGLKAT